MAYQPLWLFNAKSHLYIYIEYIGFSLVGFYGISTIVGYLMPNPVYTYQIYIYMICKYILSVIFLIEPEIFFAKKNLFYFTYR